MDKSMLGFKVVKGSFFCPTLPGPVGSYKSRRSLYICTTCFFIAYSHIGNLLNSQLM